MTEYEGRLLRYRPNRNSWENEEITYVGNQAQNTNAQGDVDFGPGLTNHNTNLRNQPC